MYWLLLRAFVKNGQLFKLKYTFIDVCKDSTGALKCLELGGALGQQSAFVHGCEYWGYILTRIECWSYLVSNIKLPVPHLEHPKSSDDYPLRVSFMDQQTVQTAHTVFMTQLSYNFENWDGMRPREPTRRSSAYHYRLCSISRIITLLKADISRRNGWG